MLPMDNDRPERCFAVVSRPNQRAEPFEHLLCGGENGEVIAHHQDQDPTKWLRGTRGGRWGHAGHPALSSWDRADAWVGSYRMVASRARGKSRAAAHRFLYRRFCQAARSKNTAAESKSPWVPLN